MTDCRRCTNEQRVKNVLAFLAILFGDDDAMWEKIMDFHPGYITEKFERYVLSERPESPWGLHPSLRRSVFNRYIEKHELEMDEME